MKRVIFYFLLVGVTACDYSKQKTGATTYDFPSPVDTSTKPIEVQQKQVFDLGNGVFLSNDFLSARLNDVKGKNDSSAILNIVSENYPVNNSPWYAFQAWSSEPRKMYLELQYKEATHRYPPKISYDGKNWDELGSDRILFDDDSVNVTLLIDLNKDTLWVAAQELYNSEQVRDWSEEVALSDFVKSGKAGESKEGRDLIYLDIGTNSNEDKDLIVILSRQHPPEVTGFFAMQAFVEGIVESSLLTNFLKKYRVLVYPLLNPDGVDMGHWRHNAGGVDLNRDWAYYKQPETRAIADHIVKTLNESGGRVLLGLDFHSTYNDVFYTQDKKEQVTPTTPWFREQWFEALEARIPGYKVNEKPKGLATPVTKGWFYSQFGAEGMTYEIGDKTPRDTIQLIGRITSEEMMKIIMANIKD